jgi:hypothetical protein
MRLQGFLQQWVRVMRQQPSSAYTVVVTKWEGYGHSAVWNFPPASEDPFWRPQTGSGAFHRGIGGSVLEASNRPVWNFPPASEDPSWRHRTAGALLASARVRPRECRSGSQQTAQLGCTDRYTWDRIVPQQYSVPTYSSYATTGLVCCAIQTAATALEVAISGHQWCVIFLLLGSGANLMPPTASSCAQT